MSLETLQKRLSGEEVEEVDSLHHINSQFITVTVGDIAEACAKYPNHPVALVYKNSIKDKAKHLVLQLNKVQIEALVENKDVLKEVAIIDGKKTTTYKLGPSLTKDSTPNKVKNAEKATT